MNKFSIKNIRNNLIFIILFISFIFVLFNFLFAENNLITSDGLIISYTAELKTNNYNFILLHGVGSNKGEWNGFIELLKKNKMGYFAYDARGHGNSNKFKNGKTLDYKNFSSDSNEWNNMLSDLDSIISFMNSKNIQTQKIVLCGASMGANISLVYSSISKKILCLVFLSGSYQKEAIINSNLKKIFMAAAKNDLYAYYELLKYEKNFNRDPRFKIVKVKSGHGVNMFDGILEKQIIAFFR